MFYPAPLGGGRAPLWRWGRRASQCTNDRITFLHPLPLSSSRLCGRPRRRLMLNRLWTPPASARRCSSCLFLQDSASCILLRGSPKRGLCIKVSRSQDWTREEGVSSNTPLHLVQPSRVLGGVQGRSQINAEHGDAPPFNCDILQCIAVLPHRDPIHIRWLGWTLYGSAMIPRLQPRSARL